MALRALIRFSKNVGIVMSVRSAELAGIEYLVVILECVGIVILNAVSGNYKLVDIYARLSCGELYFMPTRAKMQYVWSVSPIAMLYRV